MCICAYVCMRSCARARARACVCVSVCVCARASACAFGSEINIQLGEKVPLHSTRERRMYRKPTPGC